MMVTKRKTRSELPARASRRSVAQELLDRGHKVLLIERERATSNTQGSRCGLLNADACELTALQEAGCRRAMS